MSRSKVTLLDVARAAGVSRTTASSALGSDGRVSTETREHVQETARRLGYRGNVAARNLRRGRTGVLGLYLPVDVGLLEYYMRFVFGAADRAREDGYALTILLAGSEGLGLLERVDGLILVDPLSGDTGVRAIATQGVPIVSSERTPDLADGAAVVVESDQQALMFTMLDHLADRGARRPALIGSGETSSWGRHIAAAYTRWCAERRIEPLLRQTGFTASAEVVGAVATELLRRDDRPDAIISAPDGAALGVLDTARSLGLCVGEDLLVGAAVDSTPFRYVEPGITAVDHHPRDLGARCAQLALEWIESGERPEVVEPAPFDLIVRGSTRGAL